MQPPAIYHVGLDIGSTTVKVVVLDEQNKLLFRSYERHYSKARERAAETLRSIRDKLTGQQVRIVITGSAGLGVAKAADIDFVQEVYATAAAVDHALHLLGLRTDSMAELNYQDRKRVHNLKYYTWVEQQGRTAQELNDLWYGTVWDDVHRQADQLDALINAFNEEAGVLKTL